jgi:hypothetical protein
MCNINDVIKYAIALYNHQYGRKNIVAPSPETTINNIIFMMDWYSCVTHDKRLLNIEWTLSHNSVHNSYITNYIRHNHQKLNLLWLIWEKENLTKKYTKNEIESILSVNSNMLDQKIQGFHDLVLYTHPIRVPNIKIGNKINILEKSREFNNDTYKYTNRKNTK